MYSFSNICTPFHHLLNLTKELSLLLPYLLQGIITDITKLGKEGYGTSTSRKYQSTVTSYPETRIIVLMYCKKHSLGGRGRGEREKKERKH